MKTSKPMAGDWVEVRGKEEILKTLDENGQLDGMPFMPEMFAFCGKRFQVYKRAHKTCDTVFPIRGRRVERTVHLETRCSGQAHGGCQASCLIFWKEAWLKPVEGSRWKQGESSPAAPSAGCTEQDILANTRIVGTSKEHPCYSCQATRLPYATSELAWWDVRQYVEDYTSGNVGVWRVACAGAYSLFYHLSQAGIGLGPAIRWFYDKFNFLWRGTQFPDKTGRIAEGQPTPASALNLQAGELVRVKPHEEILQTVNTSSRNRGMFWGAEMVPYIGGNFRVLKRVTTIIDEKTGEMQHMKTPCIILDSVICQSRYSRCRLLCPRSIYPYWREIWLERVDPEVLPTNVENRSVQSL